MLNSDERVAFISTYITAYEAKIQASNKNGLLNSAKLFELFALEVSKLWFGKQFINMNDKTMNYPYVDLISEDNQIFVQVTTVQDINSKIKNTLEKIKNDKLKRFTNLNTIYFFSLSNSSEENVIDYTKDNKIGDIDFLKESHLITTDKIINKATTDLAFQIALYDLLSEEERTIKDTSNKLFVALNESKNISLGDIDCLINDEYEIDRTEIVNLILDTKAQFIRVRGEAGFGKSVVCKKVVEKQEKVLYARAERFTQESNINDIWHLDIENVLKYSGDVPFYFFIDSLEFIADSKKSKFDLLQSLYELIKNYPNTKVITSCRSNDESTFLKLDSKYDFKSFTINELSFLELQGIYEKYPIIKAFMEKGCYKELLKNPLYVNLIIKNITDISNISDENLLRSYIWENIICLKEKSKQYDVLYNEVVDVIKRIVFERAKQFTLGVDRETLNSKIVSSLMSEGVVVENKNLIRLKYDVFEDICFEQQIDKEFDVCRGNYNSFFSKIEEMGRCCFRRYQIWVSNKVLTKINRDKFLSNLIFSDNLPDLWTKQTMIGLVNSRFSSCFFEEYANDLIAEDLIWKLIDVTNLHAFNSRYFEYKDYPFIQLIPKGEGRPSLIKIIYEKNLYKGNNIKIESIKKLCFDYAKNDNHDKQIANIACAILITYIEETLSLEGRRYDEIFNIVEPMLLSIYHMAEYCNSWIVKFWDTQKEFIESNDTYKMHLSKKIIDHALRFTTANLSIFLPIDLCNLASFYWTINRKDSLYNSDIDSICNQYGLNKYADDYEHSINSLNKYMYFSNVLSYNFWIGLNWAISFINDAVSKYVDNKNADIESIEVLFPEKMQTKKFFGSFQMWVANSIEHSVPAVIGDIVYKLKNKIIENAESLIKHNYDFVTYLNNVKNAIFEKSNNIILLSMIGDIGIKYENLIPGYALSLATNIKIIFWDIQRYTRMNPNGDMKKLKELIFLTAGVPILNGRYDEQEKPTFILRNYVCHMQFYEESKEQCYKILDYLYSKYPNEESTANEHLQIQQMDLRSSEVEVVDKNIISILPKVSGYAKKIVDENIAENKTKINIENIINDFCQTVNPSHYELAEIKIYFEKYLEELSKDSSQFVHHDFLNILIAMSLSKNELDSKSREEYCIYWLNLLEKNFDYDNFLLEDRYLFVLYRQLDSNIGSKTKMRIKRLILDFVMYIGNNGLIDKLSNATRIYLKKFNNLSKAIFNTILMLSYDKKNHIKHNLVHLNITKEDEYKIDYDFKMHWVEQKLKKENNEYISQKERIIDSYLYNEQRLDLSNYTMDDFDMNQLACIVNCGLTSSDPEYALILRWLIRSVISQYNSTELRLYRHPYSINHFSSFHISKALSEELFDNHQIIIDILFNDAEFSSYKNDSIEFYLKIFNGLLPKYFDSYNDSAIRRRCEDILLSLEEAINQNVPDDWRRETLYRALILSVNGYEGDWSKLKTKYSYNDVSFLNNMFNKYGKYNFNYYVRTIYQMNIKELLPHILISFDVCLTKLVNESNYIISDFESIRAIIDYIILVAFSDYYDDIKSDEELTKAYESILEVLVTLKSEKAAVLLDEFRIH